MTLDFTSSSLESLSSIVDSCLANHTLQSQNRYAIRVYGMHDDTWVKHNFEGVVSWCPLFGVNLA